MRCVEAGAKGKVITFEVLDHAWDAEKMKPQRGPFIDTLYGVAYPLEGKGFDETKSISVREKIAEYCFKQAELGKRYNINFLNSSTQDTFYCSQLAYRAYLEQGIDLNTGIGIPDIPGTESIIFPQEIWNSCVHRQAVGKTKV